MLKINGRIKYTKALKRDLKSLKPLNGDEWDKAEGKATRKFKDSHGEIKVKNEAKSAIVTRLKATIREQLINLQNNRCGYCGNKLGITADGQIDHMLPKKGSAKFTGYPEHTFSVYNLVLACPKCNMVLKRTTDPLKNSHINYKYCEFYIVHPYLDDVKHHLSVGGIIISAKTFKGMRSMILFELNHEDKCMQRAMELNYKKKIDSGVIIDNLNEEHIQQILKHR